MKECNVSDMLGKTMTNVEQYGDDMIIFTADTGEVWNMYHEQDCCESVTVEDICGDLQDLVGAPLFVSEEVSNDGVTDTDLDNQGNPDNESHTWTFYKFATIKGVVTIRWYGSSNGYYSESVTFKRMTK